MSMMTEQLDAAVFPDEYADILIETLTITPKEFLSIKDALYHFRSLGDDEAAEVMQQIIEAAATAPPKAEIDIHALLAERREIAVIWGIEVVQEIRPDLTDDQCWEVLQASKGYHEETISINSSVLECHAKLLFGSAPDTDESEEA